MWRKHAARTVGLALGACLLANASGCGGSSVLKDDGSGAQGDAGDGNAGKTGGSGGTGSGGKGATGGGGSSTGGSSTGGSSKGGTSTGGTSAGGSSKGGSSKGGSSTGGTSTGGTSAGGSSKGGTGGGGTGAGPSHGFETCDDVRSDIDAELETLQACTDASECGLPLKGTSCGCTHDLVARLDADPNRFDALTQIQIDGETCASFGSDCSCPEADGFACLDERCTWNYVTLTQCEPAPLDTLCVGYLPNPGGFELWAGNPLVFTLQPSGCYSSSCTHTVTSSCSVDAGGNDFTISHAELCLGTDTTGACTDDCGGGGVLSCDLHDEVLEEGTFTVTYAGPPKLSLTFTVPSVAMDPSAFCTSIAR